MQDYHPGENVLLSFPFADATREKRRPALVRLDTGDEDIVVKRLVERRLGALKAGDWAQVRAVIQQLWTSI
jgi:hypothetical protein